jgi:uncharacterized protein DUF6916
MDQPLTADHFLPHVGQVFRVKGGRHALTLSGVEVLPLAERQAKALPRQQFTVIFAGPHGDVLREGLHVLECGGGPAFELYLMPIQTFARDRQDYQAVFN